MDEPKLLKVHDSVVDESADELITRIERETGCRVDSNDYNNLAVAGLMGAMARALGKNPHSPKDDVAAGILIRHQMSPEGQAQRESEQALASLLTMGFSPDDLRPTKTEQFSNCSCATCLNGSEQFYGSMCISSTKKGIVPVSKSVYTKIKEAFPRESTASTDDLVHQLAEKYQEIAALTFEHCQQTCSRLGWCCERDYCLAAIGYARDHFEVDLAITTNAKIPLLGPDGKCTAPPHMRPMCSVHSCDINSIGVFRGDRPRTSAYFKLREEIDLLELQLSEARNDAKL